MSARPSATAIGVFVVGAIVLVVGSLAFFGAALLGGSKELRSAAVIFTGSVKGLNVGAPVTLRVWTAGDRIRTAGAPAGRRVTRYFSEAHVPALDRSTWPVVLVENELAWVPGVCRALAAPSRPGRPELIWYRCEPEFD